MQPTQDDVVAALKWHIDMGIAGLTSEEPVDHFAQIQEVEQAEALQHAQKTQAAHASSVAKAPAPTPAVSAGLAEAMAKARALADAADSIETLLESIKSFDGCSLKKTARNTVTHEGIWHSPVMFVGEAPGADEDRNGVPFCGASGQLLDEMMKHIGLNRHKNCLISNTIYWRPPGNRQPTPEELAICQPFYEKMIALNAPKLLVAVGGTSVKALLDVQQGITKLRGKILPYTNPYLTEEIPVHIMLHPAYLLRQPMAKKQSWQDLLGLKSAIQSLS